jgi:glycosyltransferase involved in cell wall biosynthesis
MTRRGVEKPVPEVSVIIPVVERFGDLRKLTEEYEAEIRRLGKTAEFIFVVDRRQQEAIPVIREIQAAAESRVLLVTLSGAFGESTSLRVGMDHARADVLITLAAYFQVDPAGVERAFDLLDEGADLVVGRRFPRLDSFFNRIQTRVFHYLLRVMTGERFADVSCGFRVMKRTVAKELNFYGGMHRFIPILAARQGFVTVELDLPQRREDLGTRYYGVAVYLKRLLDVLTVFFLMKFTRQPLRFFGIPGLVMVVAGTLITGYLGLYRLLGLGPIGDRPLLLLGVLLMAFGIQMLSIGLIGEIIIFTHARQMREYQIAEVVRSTEESPVPAT